MKRKSKIDQFELPVIGEAFNLARESAADGERIEAERVQSLADREASELNQLEMDGET